MMRWFPFFVLRRPYVPEHDLAGVVIDGNGTALREGDWVFGWVPLGMMPTSQADYMRLDAAHRPPAYRLRTQDAAGCARPVRAAPRDVPRQPPPERGSRPGRGLYVRRDDGLPGAVRGRRAAAGAAPVCERGELRGGRVRGAACEGGGVLGVRERVGAEPGVCGGHGCG